MSEYPSRWDDEWNDLPEDMRHFATQFGPADDHVLLLGPTGSGKGYLAWILHELSPRAGGPFVQQNCGAITESLAEATLFGSMKGAYTDATESKAGVIESAEGGTLFLDEFGALSPEIQAMLLIFLEKKEFRRVGSNAVRRADIRVIAATNRDLGEAIRAGDFRQDLVGRLPLRYQVPPLRERRGEIAGIVDRHFREHGFAGELADDAMSRLRGHEWRGNVRELVSVLKYCVAVAKGGLITLDLVEEGIRNQQIGMEPSTDVGKPPKAKSDEDMKRELAEALEATGGNKSEAAVLLGIHRRTVYRRLKRFGMGRAE